MPIPTSTGEGRMQIRDNNRGCLQLRGASRHCRHIEDYLNIANVRLAMGANLVSIADKSSHDCATRPVLRFD
jgi:hypothetical protein